VAENGTRSKDDDDGVRSQGARKDMHRTKTFLAHVSPVQEGQPRVAISCTDMTQLQHARLRAFSLQQQQSAIARISELLLKSPEPSALYDEVLEALLANASFGTSGIIVELAGSTRELEVVASRGFGVGPLRSLSECGEAGRLLYIAIDRGGIVFMNVDRASDTDPPSPSTPCERGSISPSEGLRFCRPASVAPFMSMVSSSGRSDSTDAVRHWTTRASAS
jgi:hypothetical protein